jgi:hypothetical protein
MYLDGLDGLDRRRCCVIDRKVALAGVLARPPERVLLSERLACDGRALFEKVGELGAEGIVSKRIDALDLAEGQARGDRRFSGGRLCAKRLHADSPL